MIGASPLLNGRMIGIAASWLAAWCQIVLVATMPLGPLVIVADPLGNVPICHAAASGGSGQPAPTKPGHNGRDCAVCVLCQAHAWSVAILSPPPALPARQSVATVRLDAAQPRAPPVRLVAAALPRGPPSLI
jgi:hypothetical protein